MAEVHPTLSEWDDLPYTVQQAFTYVRMWTEELKAERLEEGRKAQEWRRRTRG